jgi:hypothetical protein
MLSVAMFYQEIIKYCTILLIYKFIISFETMGLYVTIVPLAYSNKSKFYFMLT